MICIWLVVRQEQLIGSFMIKTIMNMTKFPHGPNFLLDFLVNFTHMGICSGPYKGGLLCLHVQQ